MQRGILVFRLCTRRSTWLNHTRHRSSFPDHLIMSEEVRSALSANRPVVALETTIVTHGMPYPQNLRMANEVEDLVRNHGSTPATIGVIDGKIHIGLNYSQLDFLADPKTQSIKTSRRDLSYIISQKLHGGTTVSGTMMIANMAGISLFVTGGIGGVHRGGEISLDVSADLRELGRTPVAVISSGVKSILDIGRTLEYLETEGVCVATYGKTNEFPAFFSRQSGYLSPYRTKTPTEAAKLIDSNHQLGLQSGTLIAVPIPERYDILGQEIETVIQSVIVEAQDSGIQGKDITPYILSKVNERTEGKSLEANIHLVKNNAVVGSQIAVALANLQQAYEGSGRINNDAQFKSASVNGIKKQREGLSANKKKVTVIGGSIVDFYANLMSEEFQVNGATYPGKVKQTFGGVGRNIADGLSRLGADTCFISAIGCDSHRAAFESYCSHMDLSAVQRLDGESTATYCAVLGQSGELLFGIGDMDIHKQITPELVSQYEDTLLESSLVCVDGNLPEGTLEYVSNVCQQSQVPVLFDPADLHKASKPFLTSAYQGLSFVTPNFNELRMMAGHIAGKKIPLEVTADDLDNDKVLHECVSLLDSVCNHIPVVMVTLGKHGVVLCHPCDSRSRPFEIKREGRVSIEYYPAVPPNSGPLPIVSVSGAGDCMIAAMVSYILEGQALDTAVKAGLLAAQISLQSMQAVPTTLTAQAIHIDNVNKFMNVQPQKIK